MDAVRKPRHAFGNGEGVGNGILCARFEAVEQHPDHVWHHQQQWDDGARLEGRLYMHGRQGS